MKKTDLWKTVLGELQINISHAHFSLWLSPTRITQIKLIDDQRQIIEIATPNPFIRDTIETRYYGQIKTVLDRLTQKNNELVFLVKEKAVKTPPETDTGPLFQQAQTQGQPLTRPDKIKEAIAAAHLRPDFNFETFAVSSSNEMAYAAAQAVAEKPGSSYNLLFLYGGVGVGKTHLMQAVGHRIIEKNSDTALVYCTGEEFTNDIIEAIRKKSTDIFRKKYRGTKALLIDDIQFIAGKDTVQEEFFHTFNALQAEGAQIVTTSDKLPEEIEGLEDRLRSRFEGGLMVDIQEPNFELRAAILLIKARAAKIDLPMDVAQLIAANVDSTRRLEGVLMRLASETKIKKQPITPELVQAILGKTSPQTEKGHQLIPNEVIETVAQYYQLKTHQIKGKRRLKHLVGARHLAMYIIRTEIEIPLTRVGRLFGGRDHTSVLHAVEKITKDLSQSEELRIDLSKIKKSLYGNNSG